MRLDHTCLSSETALEWANETHPTGLCQKGEVRTIQLGEKAVRMADHRQVPGIVTVTGLRLG